MAKFNLSTNQITLRDFGEWIGQSAKQRPWYRVLESSPRTGSSFLANVRATGQITTEHLQVQRVMATKVSAKVTLDSGKVQVSEFNADFLGGKHRGQWSADFGGKAAVCEGKGSLNGVSLTGFAEAMKDGWIAGVASGTYAVKGPCSPEFWTSSEGTLQFDMRDGSLPHVVLSPNAEALTVDGFAGQVRLHDGEIEMKDARLKSPEGDFLLSGTASLRGELDFRLARTPGTSQVPGYVITGTLEEPEVNALAGETQARLKP
jgi:hypothetical protein